MTCPMYLRTLCMNRQYCSCLLPNAVASDPIPCSAVPLSAWRSATRCRERTFVAFSSVYFLYQRLDSLRSSKRKLDDKANGNVSVRTESTRSSWAGVSLQNNQHRVRQTSTDAMPHHDSATKITTRNFCNERNERCWPKQPKGFDV